ncbi:hypothetical protein IPC72_25500 [Pseudomonas aeruginosa]|uniref:hypothetical protein n=1 Tax=Pseudomonas aeruginosa TaxID=287 RepID=UPI001051DF40|nr:hypothetical protein [Pseudomonas aeruginosa]EKQ6319240.1 hypothetical protein [Pseudomonas aeruginosa]TEP56591.1 hypothetical protein IPC72_25500 [Pseudomonas aeruginosa]TEP75318.1 hypothetical protein IPC71_20440 [Pseudomonas aeruginosa]HBO9015040.1 hypothetical protein [Pseudomonas aeruginosa]
MNDFLGFIFCIAAAVFLTWLFTEARIYPESVEYAASACASNEGWAYIDQGHSDEASVKCKNGAEFEFKQSQLGEKK